MADIVFRLVIRDDGTPVIERFDNKLKDTKKKAQSAAAAISKAFRRTTDRVKNLVSSSFNLRNALIGLGAGLVVRSILRAGDVAEKARLRLVGLAGGVAEANALFENFRVVAAGVAFSLEEVIQGGVALEAFGTSSRKFLVPLTDLAALMGTNLPEAASALGRAFAGGRGAADIFRERGILRIIDSFAQLNDIATDTLPGFRKALEGALLDPTGPIANAAKRLATTFTGQISFMQDAIFELQLTIAEAGVLKFAKENIAELTKAVKALVLSFDSSAIDDTAGSLNALIIPAEVITDSFFVMERAVRLVFIGFLAIGTAAQLLITIGANLTDAIGLTTDAAVDQNINLELLSQGIDDQVDALKRNVEQQERATKSLGNLGDRSKKTAKDIEKTTDAVEILTGILVKPILPERGLLEILNEFQKARTRFFQQQEQDIGFKLPPLPVPVPEELRTASAAFRTFLAERISEIQTAGEQIKVGLKNSTIDTVKGFASLPQLAQQSILQSLLTTQGGIQVQNQAFIDATNEQLEIQKEFVQKQQDLDALKNQTLTSGSAKLFGSLAALAQEGGEKTFAIGKAFAVAQATVSGIQAVQAALASPPGPPFTIPLAAAIAIQTALNVRKILSTSPGGGGGGGAATGAGAGGVAAPVGGPGDIGVPVQEGVQAQQGISVVVDVAGFVGDEALLASEIGRLVREGIGDDVQFTVDT